MNKRNEVRRLASNKYGWYKSWGVSEMRIGGFLFDGLYGGKEVGSRSASFSYIRDTDSRMPFSIPAVLPERLICVFFWKEKEENK